MLNGVLVSLLLVTPDLVGMRMSSEGDRQDVRMQEAWEEADQEEEGGGDGTQWETAPSKSQQQIRCKFVH